MTTAPHEAPPAPAPTPPNLHLLDRPRADRTREFRYRFAQSAIFGAPVLALHLLGPTLGGPTASTWTGLLQSILAGWILYLAATGLIIEGLALLILRRRLSLDFLVALAATVLYLLGLYAYLRLLLHLAPPQPSRFFLLSTLLLCLWSLLRWSLLARRAA